MTTMGVAVAAAPLRMAEVMALGEMWQATRAKQVVAVLHLLLLMRGLPATTTCQSVCESMNGCLRRL